VLPAAFEDWRCEVVALDLERTFWEKATILHAEFHRRPAETLPERYARHYSDMAALARHPSASAALPPRTARSSGRLEEPLLRALLGSLRSCSTWIVPARA
jgi:hypothetical protein